jgi:hypothetical protein
MVAHDDGAELQRALFEQLLCHCLRQQQKEGKARLERGEVQWSCKPTEVAEWQRSPPRDEAIRNSAQREHFERPSLHRQRAGLCDALDPPFEDRDFHTRQCKLTGKPKAHRAATYNHNIEFVIEDRHRILLFKPGPVRAAIVLITTSSDDL